MASVYGMIGLGLIGGSIAKGLKAAEPDCRIFAYMRTAAKLDSVISAILAAGGISIKNIGINHNRESGSGALRIEFYDAASCSAAARKLTEYNYEVVMQ